jgi:hypothetical protein
MLSGLALDILRFSYEIGIFFGGLPFALDSRNPKMIKLIYSQTNILKCCLLTANIFLHALFYAFHLLTWDTHKNKFFYVTVILLMLFLIFLLFCANILIQFKNGGYELLNSLFRYILSFKG